jgi:hypothetical protein
MGGRVVTELRSECVLVLERETGDVDVLVDRNALLGHVSEFFDISEQDFLYVDEQGCVLNFDKRYLNGGDVRFVQRRQLTPSEARACLLGMNKGLSYSTMKGEVCVSVLKKAIERTANAEPSSTSSDS